MADLPPRLRPRLPPDDPPSFLPCGDRHVSIVAVAWNPDCRRTLRRHHVRPRRNAALAGEPPTISFLGRLAPMDRPLLAPRELRRNRARPRHAPAGRRPVDDPA